MPFTYLDSVSNVAHRGLSFLRIIFRFAPEHFIAQKNKAGLNLKTILDANGRLRTCQLCGFALASYELNEEWTMEACSATGFKEIRNQAGFNDWLERLRRGQKSKACLKTDDVSRLAEKSYTCH